MPLIIPDYIEIRTAAGQLALAVLSPDADGLKDCYTDARLNGPCTLSFSLPLHPGAEKWAYLTDAYRIVAAGREFAITKPDAVDVTRDGQKLWGKVVAEEIWVLLNKKYITVSNDPANPSPPWGTVSIISGGTTKGGYAAGSAGNALAWLLEGSGWSIGTVDVTGTHDLETEKEDLLSNIQKVQEVWGGNLVWDSINKTVSLRSETAWQNYTGFQIRYAKNLKGITRTVDFDLVTKLYPFGTDDLNIYDVGILSSGTAQGGGVSTITLATSALAVNNCYIGATVILTGGTGSGQSKKITAYNGSTKVATVDSNWVTVPNTTTAYEVRAIFLLNFQHTNEIFEGIYENQELAVAQRLRDKAIEVLSTLSRPRYSYRVGLVDLRTLPECQHEDFALGDMVDVIDEGMGVNIRARVMRHKYNVFQPWRCELEIGDPIETLAVLLAGSQKAADFVKEALKPNPSIGNMLKGFVNTFATTINSANGKLVWDDSTLQAIEIDANGQETGKRVRITPGGIGISIDGGQTYVTAMTGQGILANTIVCNALYALATEDGFTRLEASGLHVYDDLARERLIAGWWMDGATKRFGLNVKAADGATTLLDDRGILQTWQEGRADNVDSASPLALNVYLPPETRSIRRALLRFRRQAFRAYSTGAASGGGGTQTSTAGGATSPTTSSGGGAYRTSDVQILASGQSQDITVGGGGHSHGGSTDSVGNHNHGISDGTSLALAGGGSVTFRVSGAHSHSISSEANHVHVLYNHKHETEIPSHTHGVNIPNHSHDVTFPSHTHGIVYGIFTSTLPTNTTVRINGTDRTVALGGPFNSDQVNLNIASFLMVGQWNTIELGSGQLGRIDASVFIQVLMGI